MLCTRTHEADKALSNLTMRRFSSLGHRLRGAALLRRETFDEAVGNTPLIKLQGPSAATGCDIYGKCEFMNPAGSVKDRAALNIFREAEAAGKLQRGGVIVEGTAGNTGIGLAAVAATRGVRCVVVIPETQTEEKKAALRQLGARVVEVPAAPYKSENNYQKVSKRLAEALGGVWANQFDNTANRDAHVRTTDGPCRRCSIHDRPTCPFSVDDAESRRGAAPRETLPATEQWYISVEF